MFVFTVVLGMLCS